MIDKVYSFLGLATRAGKVVSGGESAEITIKCGKAYLVIVAEDASDNTKKRFLNLCNFRNIILLTYGEKELIGKYTGKDTRSVVAVTDRGFAKRLQELVLANQ